MEDKFSKVFNSHQGTFWSQWLNVVSCKNLGMKLDNQQFRIPIGLVSEPTCVLRIHGLSCTKSAGRLSRHYTLTSH